jgi:hypothetical protein
MTNRMKACLAVALLCLSFPAGAQTTAPPAGMLQTAAAAYAEYHSHVSRIRDKPLSGAEDLDRALDLFGAQNASQLASGWLAYTALIAARNPEFAGSVRDIDQFYGRERVLAGMRNDPGYARTLKGGEDALQAALTANAADAMRILEAAAFVKDQAIRLQSVTWGKSRFRDASGAAARLKTTARASRPIAETALRLFQGPDLERLLAAAGGPERNSVWDRIAAITASAPALALGLDAAAPEGARLEVDPRRQQTADRIMTLAAFHVLNAEAAHPDDVAEGLKDRLTQDCIDWSQLQLQACVSAAYTRADLSFCLAEHAIRDAGACFKGLSR